MSHACWPLYFAVIDLWITSTSGVQLQLWTRVFTAVHKLNCLPVQVNTLGHAEYESCITESQSCASPDMKTLKPTRKKGNIFPKNTGAGAKCFLPITVHSREQYQMICSSYPLHSTLIQYIISQPGCKHPLELQRLAMQIFVLYPFIQMGTMQAMPLSWFLFCFNIFQPLMISWRLRFGTWWIEVGFVQQPGRLNILAGSWQNPDTTLQRFTRSCQDSSREQDLAKILPRFIRKKILTRSCQTSSRFFTSKILPRSYKI